MRRSIAAAVVALSTALSITSVASTSSAATGGGTPATSTPSAQARAEAALHTAQAVMSGRSTKTDPTLALVDLRTQMSHLSGRSLQQAQGLLARPTDHPDPYGDAYSVKAKKKCKGHFCIHWVSSTSDAPPSKHWVNKQLKMMQHVWKFEVGKLGYRKPLKDGHRGGNGKFDVYLKDLFPQGYYGYCAPERHVSYSRHLYDGFCVLDNDFARSQYGAPPMASAKVTSAHEFFHAIQFAYDTLEDHWMMEVSSTWMERQFDPKSHDNFQYLPDGQLRKPNVPLDTFQNPCCAQYANWVFFQYLSQHYGRTVIKHIWKQAGDYRGAGHKYSTKAIAAALHKHGGFKKVFAKYAAGNLTSGRTYKHLKGLPSAPYSAKWKLSKGHRKHAFKKFRVRHLASRNIKLRPATSLHKKSWRVRITVHGPRRHKDPAVYVVVHMKHHKWIKKLVHVNKSGNGHIVVPFSRKRVKVVTITMANASTAFKACNRGHRYSCGGVPRVKNAKFKVSAKAFKHHHHHHH